MQRDRVVIVGAGFGGLAAARRLAGKPVDVTVVDRRNHHLFQPLLYQVATAALSPADIAAPIRSILSNARNVRVLLDEVAGVRPGRNLVDLASGRSLGYDWLILATGARHSYFGRDCWASYAPGLKTIDDALAIRRNVLLALERAETESDPDRRRALLTFVVIGAGPTGVEMAGAIAELARRSVSRDFRSITAHCSRVLLIEAGERVLAGFPPELSAAAERSLRELGVEVRLGVPVADLGAGYVQLGNELILARTVVWAAGVQASPAAEWLGAEHDESGRVFVERDLRVSPHERIFVIGDTANAPGRDGRALPAVAPVAKQQGQYAADAILGRAAPAFAYRDFGNLATIGRSKAVIDWGQLRLSGFGAWLIWSVAHIWFLVGFRSRIAVAISWLWSYATYQRSARLITGEERLARPPLRSQPASERKCA
ncbi:MAG TPA: NAD(P)/FAD-dependent oxidoreductase [Sphingomicrobium sp.]|nr:NAD(P)/FAD-dependent oxidoreductase [Sphingomicrobium sp.]